jgi:hypothetical protein
MQQETRQTNSLLRSSFYLLRWLLGLTGNHPGLMVVEGS